VSRAEYPSGRFEARRRGFHVLAALIYAGFGIVTLWYVDGSAYEALRDSWFDLLIAGLALLLALFELWRYLNRRPDLAIDGYGLLCRGYSNDPIPWSAIELVGMKTSGGSDCLIVWLRSSARVQIGLTGAMSAWLQRRSTGGDIIIHPELLDTDLDRIAREIERFHPVPIRWVD
jgi:hypothetical protein